MRSSLMRESRRAGLTTLAVVLCAGIGALAQTTRPSAGRAAPAPPAGRGTQAAGTERAVPFRIGETLNYDISWSSFLTAGTAVVNVREKRPSLGSTAYRIVAEGQPTPLVSRLYPLYYKIETLLDASSLFPQQGLIYSQEGNRTRTKITRFDQKARTATFELQPPTQSPRRFQLTAPTHDALSAFFSLRSMTLTRGTTVTIPVTNEGETFGVRVTVDDREPLRTGSGTVTAWRIRPVLLDEDGEPASAYRLVVWLSDDARRVPLRLEADLGFGAFVFTLRQ
jgi:hypothetical protein